MTANCPDLNSGGVMWGVKSLAHHDRKNKYRVLGRPQKTQAEWNNQVHRRPGDLVRTVKVPESLLEDSVYLGDFGMAFRTSGAGQKVVFPTFTAPERLHGIAPSAASDMWSYTVILAHLFFGKLTFTYAPTPMFNSTSAPPPLMTRLFDSFGPLPSEWKERYTEQGTVPGSYYGTPQGFSPHFHNTIENNLPQLSATDRSHLESVLSRGFQYHPEKRLTAAELLKDPSFIALTTVA
jgi:serine/threonine protein kinase